MTIEPGGTFTWQGQRLDYLDAAYNGPTLQNERAVEVPIARRWLSGVASAGDIGLEVGNVLAHYPPAPPRRVIDLYEWGEPRESVENIDLFDVTDRFAWVLAISTCEHVRWDGEPWDLNGSLDAIAHLRSLLNPGGRLLVTVPLNHQPALDVAILTGTLDATTESTMMLDEECTEWTEHPGGHFGLYGRFTRWASAVWVAEWVAPDG